MADAFRFEIKIDQSQAVPALDALKDHTQKVTGKMSMAFNSVTAKITAATFAINQVTQAVQLVGNALSYPLQQFKEFETAMANVASLGVENIDALKTSVLNMGETVPLAFKDMAEGLYQVVSAGVDAQHQIQVLEASAKAGVAGLSTTKDALNLASAVIKGYGKSWSETNSIMDMAFQTVKLGQTTFEELAGSIGRVVPLASALKVSSQELFGAFATLTGVTGDANEVATQLRGILGAVAKPTQELAGLMKKLGYESATAALKQEGLAGFLKIIAKETGGNADEMAKLFGRIKAVNAALALSGPQFDTYIQKTEAMRESTGAMDKAFKTNADTIENHWQIFENKFNKVLIETVERVRPIINSLIDFGSALMDIDFDYFIAGISAATAALATFSIAKTVTEVSTLGPALMTAARAVWAFAAETASAMATATAGISLLVGAIAGLVTYLVIAGDNEQELARKRAETAKKTIGLIEAEKKRVEQAIETQGATQELTDKLDKLNEKLLAQQKILSDAKLDEYKAKLKDAVSDLNDLHQGLYDMFTEKAHILGALQRKYGEDYIAMEEEVTNRLSEISDKLYQQKVGYIHLSEDQIDEMKDEQAAYNTIMEYLSKAADAQRQYNDELKRNKELHEGSITKTTNQRVNVEIGLTPEESEEEDPILGYVNILREKLPKYSQSLKMHIPIASPQDELEQRLTDWQEELAKETTLLNLKHSAGLVSDQDYLEQRKNLLEQQAEFAKSKYGEESEEYLNLKAQEKQAEEDLSNFIAQQYAERIQMVVQGMEAITGILDGFAQLEQQKRNRKAQQDKEYLRQEILNKKQALDFELKTGKISEKEYQARLKRLNQYEQQRTQQIEAEQKKQSGIEKMAARFRTIIATYEMATKAFNALVGIPFVGPALGTAAAAAAIALGLANLREIEAAKYYAGGLVDASGRVLQKGNYGDGENRLIIANDEEFIVNREATKRNLALLTAINNGEDFSIIFPPAPEGHEDFTITMPQMAQGGEISGNLVSNNQTTIINQSAESDSAGIIDRLEAIERAIKDLELTADFDDTEMAIRVRNANQKINKILI